MSFLFNMCSIWSPLSDQELATEYLAQINATSNESLPENYKQLFKEFAKKSSKANTFLKVLIGATKTMKSIPALIKVYTVVLSEARELQYNEDYMECLDSVDMPQVEQMKWFKELCGALVSYLSKIPSIADVVARACTWRNGISLQLCLIDLYRIVNHVGLLFPNLNNCINTVGRYYMATSAYFHQFYRVLREELLLIYSYFKYAVEKVMKGHKECEQSQLECFFKTIPEVELLCDKLEDFLMNKYFKGKNITRKIYLQEEQVSEISYFLQLNKKEQTSFTNKILDSSSIAFAKEEQVSPIEFIRPKLMFQFN